MKINKNFKIAIFSFLVLGLATATTVSAYQGIANNENNDRANLNINNNPISYEDRAERMRASHENMSAEDLEKRNEIHELMIKGEYEKALKIKDELGVGSGMGKSQGMRRGNNNKDKGIRPNFIDANNNGVCDNMENNN